MEELEGLNIEGATIKGKNDPDITYVYKDGEWQMETGSGATIKINQDEFFEEQFNIQTYNFPTPKYLDLDFGGTYVQPRELTQTDYIIQEAEIQQRYEDNVETQIKKFQKLVEKNTDIPFLSDSRETAEKYVIQEYDDEDGSGRFILDGSKAFEEYVKDSQKVDVFTFDGGIKSIPISQTLNSTNERVVNKIKEAQAGDVIFGGFITDEEDRNAFSDKFDQTTAQLNLNQIKQILDYNEDEAKTTIEALITGAGYKVEKTNTDFRGFLNTNALKITKIIGGESVTVNFGIKDISTGDRFKDNYLVYESEFNKLINFINNTSDEEDIEAFKKNRRSNKSLVNSENLYAADGWGSNFYSDALIQELQKNSPLSLKFLKEIPPGGQVYRDVDMVQKVAGPAFVTPSEKRALKQEIDKIDNAEFFTQTQYGYFDPTTQVAGPVVLTTPQERKVKSKYESQRIKALKNLESKGISPTTEKIIKETKKVLLQERILELRESKLTDFHNSEEIKDTKWSGKYKAGELQITKSSNKEKAIIAKAAANHANQEKVLDDLLNTEEGQLVTSITNDLNNQSLDETLRVDIKTKYTREELEKASDYYEKILLPQINKTEEAINNFTLVHSSLSKKVENQDYIRQINLASYDLYDKFLDKLSSMTVSIGVGAAYGVQKTKNLLGETFGLSKRDVSLDYRYQAFQEKQQKEASFYQRDVAFGNAFDSVDNFGRFFLQELANQAPIFAAIATGNPGIFALSAMSAGEFYSEAEKTLEATPDERSSLSLLFKGIGYGASEFVFNKYLALPMLKNNWKLMSGNKYSKLLKEQSKSWMPKKYSKNLIVSPLIESLDESLTTISQNLIAGRPITENLAHSAFSGGMFGVGFSSVPAVKGMVMNVFADNSKLEDYRQNITKLKNQKAILKKLKISLKANNTKGNNTENLQRRIQTVENQIAQTEQNQKDILEKEEAKLNNMDKLFYDAYNEATIRQQDITVEAREISKDFEDGKITREEATIQLDDLKLEFDKLQSSRDYMRSDENFGTAYAGFKVSNKQEDIILRNQMKVEAQEALKKKGIVNPNESQIENQTKLIYNTYKINQDYEKASGIFKEGGKILGRNVLAFQNFQTAQEAIDYVNNLSDDKLPLDLKQKIVKVIKDGGHGSNIVTNDGDIIPFQVVENMAKDDRLETRTHELGHAIFRIAFANKDFDQIGVSKAITDYLQQTNPALLTVLLAKSSKGSTDQKTAEELIVNFFELVASGKIDLKDKKKSRGLGAFVSYLLRNETTKVLGDNADFNFAGETDAINFLVNLAKQIKEGTIKAEDIADIKISKVLGSKVQETTQEGAVVDFSEAKAKQTLNFIQEEATIDGNFDKDKFNPNDPRIISQLQGMVNAQISNLSINQFLTNDGRAELQQQTLVELFSRGDIAKFNGKGTLYGFINGRIKFSIKDAFKNNPAIVEDFNKADLDETMKQLDTQEVDTAPLDDKIVDETIASDAKINVLALTNKELEVVGVINAEGDYKTVIDNNVGNVGNKIFNIPGKKISDPKANITTSTKIVDPNTGKVISKKDLKAGKKGILSPSEAKNIQDFFSKISTVKKFIQILPKENVTKKDADINKLGENIDVSREVFGRGIGLPRRILEYFYQPKMENGKRVRSQGKTSQVPMWELKPGFTNLNDAQLTEVAKQFQKDLGITEDGLTNILPTAANRSKIGQLLKGAALVMSQQASLSGAQRIKETQLKETKEADAKAKIKQEIADITTGQADVAFSQKVKNDVLRLINFNTVFQLDTTGVDQLLDINSIAKTFNLKTEKGRKEFLEKIKTDLLPIMPREFWFTIKNGKVTNDVFTYSGKNYKLSMSKYTEKDRKKGRIPKGKKVGDFKKPKEAKMYDDFRNEIRALANDPNVKFGESIEGVDFTLTKTYSTIFGDKTNYLQKMNNVDDIKAWNDNISKIHEAMWQRFTKVIRKDKKMASVIGTYLKLTANDKQSWHRLGAQIAGYSTSITNRQGGKAPNIEFEHAMPATSAYLYLLNVAIDKNSNFDAAYKLVVDNYKLIVLDKAMDDKLRNAKTKSGYSLMKRMPDNWDVASNNWWERYFNETVFNVDGKGINPNSIVDLDGNTFADKFNINSKGQPSVVTSIDNSVKQSSKLQIMARTDYSKNPRGMSAFDFDETLIDKGENTIIAKKGDDVVEISSGDWPLLGPQYAADGYNFDFSDFINVKGGVAGPLLQKLKNRIKKFGASNNYILTARPAESAPAIHAWLKTQNINIPLENITGLGNSTGEAKALWILDKFAQGYNDIYFVDDALPNVKAVADVIDQLDIKGKSVQARADFSQKLNFDFNKILEQTTGIEAQKRFSDAQAKLRGKGFKFTGVIPPSAQDFAGLLYSFLSPGRLGEKQFKFFKETLIDPFARGVNELNTSRQKSAEDYKNLLSKYPDVRKDLKKSLSKFEGYEGVKFTVDQAVRVYLWTKAGFDVPGLSARDLKLLTDFVKSDSELTAFADAVGLISKKERGYAEPGEYWLTENINSDLMSDGAIGEVRADFLADFINNKNEIFSPENMNKIEAAYGPKFREALEDILFRMETGRNLPRGGGRLMQEYTSWVNGSVGAIMFFNMRSALLQTISAVNYINWSDNNPLKAAMAFANQKQFWSDFVFLFNSDFLKQRRVGNRRGVNEAELSQAVAGKGPAEQAKAAIRYLLKIGFLPTQIADSFAIASGGASFYRNRVNSYLKQGMSQADAEAQAFLDFQETTEVSQQSARPDLISQQQANPLGRLILAFANTPMQYGRIIDKSFRDIVNNRGDFKTNTSKIIYYGAVQSIIFSALQTALFAVIGSEEEEKDELISNKLDRILNNTLDTFLTTFGYGGKAISTAKNTAMEYLKQRDKDVDDNFMTRSDHAYTLLQALSFSPPISSKARKIYSSIQTEKYNRDIIKERGFKLDNPVWAAFGNVIEGVTNIPLGRLSNKMLNLDNALDSRNETWQRLALIMGWNTWDLGIKDHDIEALDIDIKERKKIKKEQEKIKEKYEKKKNKLMEKYPDLDEEQIDIKIQSEKYYPLRKYEQIELLKKLDLSDKEIKQLKKESDRAEKINELYKGNEELIDNYLTNSQNKTKEDKDKEQEALKPKKKKPTREKSLYRLNKKEQVNLLFELGLGLRSAYSLRTEKERVNKILELEKKSK